MIDWVAMFSCCSHQRSEVATNNNNNNVLGSNTTDQDDDDDRGQLLSWEVIYHEPVVEATNTVQVLKGCLISFSWPIQRSYSYHLSMLSVVSRMKSLVTLVLTVSWPCETSWSWWWWSCLHLTLLLPWSSEPADLKHVKSVV